MRCKKCGGVKQKTYTGLLRPVLLCRECRRNRILAAQTMPTAPATCPGCRQPVQAGQLTCGRYACVEIYAPSPAVEVMP